MTAREFGDETGAAPAPSAGSMPQPRSILAALLLGAVQAVAAQDPAWNRAQPLPVPDGAFAVGTRTVTLVDSSRPSSSERSSRPLAIQLWYPTADTSGARARYVVPAALIDTMLLRQYYDILPSILGIWRSLPVPAWSEAPPLATSRGQGWPVLLFSHGGGVSRANYTALVTAMASHGYVVVAIDHPMSGFTLAPDGALLAPGVADLPYKDRPYANLTRDMARDASFVLDRLASVVPVALDTARVGYFGHSLGGASALDACIVDRRLRACVDMDGSPFGEAATKAIRKPFLVLLSEPDQRDRPPAADSAEARRRAEFARMGRERDEEWAMIGKRNGTVPWHVVKILGTGHFSFSDGPFQLPMQLQGVGATLAPIEMHQVTERLLLDFFGHYLDGRPLAHLRGGATTLP